MEPATLAKARKRIKKFVETGEHQPRTYATDDPQVFEYKVKHHVESLFFKADVLGRLRLLSK